jgi:hypothetical protein
MLHHPTNEHFASDVSNSIDVYLNSIFEEMVDKDGPFGRETAFAT